MEYLQEDKLKAMVQRYSEFINFPIKLLVTKSIEEEIALEGAELEAAFEKEAALKAEKEDAGDAEEKKEDKADGDVEVEGEG